MFFTISIKTENMKQIKNSLDLNIGSVNNVLSTSLAAFYENNFESLANIIN